MILDSSIYRINHYPADTTIPETNGVIHWIEIYPVEAKALFITFWTVGSGAPNQKIVQNHLNMALLNVF